MRMRTVAVLLLAFQVLAACASPRATPTTNPALVPPKAKPGELVGVLPNSDLAVGPNNRFLLGILDDRNRPVADAAVQLRFFKVLDASNAQLRSEAPATYRGAPELGNRGVYVARTGFDEPGPWGVEIQAKPASGEAQVLRLGFEVKPQSATPAIGALAPPSRSATGATPAEVEAICSARPADDFHKLSIADALAQKKPLLVLFSTPGFCETATCGPALDFVQRAAAPHGDKLNVVHVEIFEGGKPPNNVKAVDEWGLTSEPWVFLVDAEGKIADKFEGAPTPEELGPALARLVGG